MAKIAGSGQKNWVDPQKYEENSNRRQNLEIKLYKAIKNRKVSFNRSGDLGQKEKSKEKNN